MPHRPQKIPPPPSLPSLSSASGLGFEEVSEPPRWVLVAAVPRVHTSTSPGAVRAPSSLHPSFMQGTPPRLEEPSTSSAWLQKGCAPPRQKKKNDPKSRRPTFCIPYTSAGTIRGTPSAGTPHVASSGLSPDEQSCHFWRWGACCRQKPTPERGGSANCCSLQTPELQFAS